MQINVVGHRGEMTSRKQHGGQNSRILRFIYDFSVDIKKPVGHKPS